MSDQKEYIKINGLETKNVKPTKKNGDLIGSTPFDEDYKLNVSEDVEDILDNVLEKYESGYIPSLSEALESLKSSTPDDFPTGKGHKEYIDSSIYKTEDEKDESWLNPEDKDEDEEKEKPSKKFQLPSFISPHTFLMIVLGILIVVVLALTAPKDVPRVQPQIDNEPDKEVIIVHKEISQEQLTELTQVIELYTEYKNQSDNLRNQEIKVLNGYIKGDYTRSQVETLFMQTMQTKEIALAHSEGISVSSNLSELKILFERFLRADLNHTKKVLSNILNGQKAQQILNEYAGTVSTNLENQTNYCNELERVLIMYNVQYTRNQNVFSY